MAGALDEIIAHIPAGVSVYDGLRAYFIGHVYPTHPAWDRGAITVIALCGGVIVIVLASLLIRARNGGINFLIKDSAMTRLEFRTFAPILFAVFAIFEIVLTALVMHCNARHEWTWFVGGFQFMSLMPLVCTAHLIFINIVAQAPICRNYLLGAGTLRRRGLMGVSLLAGLLLVLLAASVGSVMWPSLMLAGYTAKQTTDVNVIVATIDAAQAANDQALLAGLAPQIAELLHTSDRLKAGIRYGGIVYSIWCAFWIIGGAIPYTLLDRAVRKKIMRLERSLSEEAQSRHVTTLLGGGRPRDRDRDVHSSGSSDDKGKHSGHGHGGGGKFSTIRLLDGRDSPKTYGFDKPFGNLEVVQPTTEMPDRYAAIIDSQIVETSQKIERLRVLLKQDATHHALYLAMILIYTSEAMFQALGAVNAVDGDKLLVMLHSYNATAFLLVGLPSVVLYLIDSLRSRRANQRSAGYDIRRRTILNNTTFEIPLHLAANPKEEVDLSRQTGIVVNQVHEVVVENSTFGAEDDASSMKKGSV